MLFLHTAEWHLGGIFHQTHLTAEQDYIVTPRFKRMLSMITGKMSRTGIISTLELRDEEPFREHYRQAALAADGLEMTIRNKPRSRLQKH